MAPFWFLIILYLFSAKVYYNAKLTITLFLLGTKFKNDFIYKQIFEKYASIKWAISNKNAIFFIPTRLNFIPQLTCF